MEEGLNTKLKNVEDKLDAILGDTKVKKPKKFKLPFRARINKRKAKDNWITVVRINENKGVDFTKERIVDETIMVNDVPRLATGEDVLNYKGKPLMIIPSWSVKPFSPSADYHRSMKDGSNTAGYSLLLARMKMGAISNKKKLGLGMGIGALILVGVIAYALFAN